MKVSELIEELKKYDGDMEVLNTNNYDEPYGCDIDVDKMYLTENGVYKFARYGIFDDEEEDTIEPPEGNYTNCSCLVIS